MSLLLVLVRTGALSTSVRRLPSDRPFACSAAADEGLHTGVVLLLNLASGINFRNDFLSERHDGEGAGEEGTVVLGTFCCVPGESLTGCGRVKRLLDDDILALLTLPMESSMSI